MRASMTMAAVLLAWSSAAVADQWTKPGWYIAYLNYAETPRLVSKPFETEEACLAEAEQRKKSHPDVAIAPNVTVLAGEFRCRYFESEAAVQKYLFG